MEITTRASATKEDNSRDFLVEFALLMSVVGKGIGDKLINSKMMSKFFPQSSSTPGIGRAEYPS